MRFVNSLGLGKEPSFEPLRRRLARSPGVRFKLDAEATWTPALVDEVAATGAVDTIDFKGHYGFEVEDPEALGALYDRVLAAFPDAYLEDPHDLPEIAQRLGDHLERVSYDAPIRSAEDIGATPLAARVVNVKPSRIGSLRALFEVYARCARERRPMYGGGMGELGVGRGQIELLAALFHADAPNDVAPSAYNEDDPADGLPPSPLAPRPRPSASAGRRRQTAVAASQGVRSRAGSAGREHLESGCRRDAEYEVSAQVLAERLSVVLPYWFVDTEGRQDDVAGSPDSNSERGPVPELRRAQDASQYSVRSASEQAIAPMHDVGDKPHVLGPKLAPGDGLDKNLADLRRCRRVLPTVQPRGRFPIGDSLSPPPFL